MRSVANPQDKAAILERLSAVGPHTRARWGRMSAHQMVCHLGDSLRMVTGEKQVRPRATLVQRTIVKWVVLYLPFPWPAGLPTSPEIDQEDGGTQPVEFEADVVEVKALLERLAAQPGPVTWSSHPLFGKMTRNDWLRLVYLHTDHHLRQFGV
jgi:hypothetical protein